jgi:hypothetical protein
MFLIKDAVSTGDVVGRWVRLSVIRMRFDFSWL